MSQARHCMIYKATDAKWYLELGAYEYHWSEEGGAFDQYGPFATEDKAEAEIRCHSNPGGGETDRDGTRAPPTFVWAARTPTVSRRHP